MSMGIQNAAARSIAVPDLTTTVLTLTITGIAADSSLAGGSGAKAGRRLTAVATMLVGAFIGAALVRHAQIWAPLLIALVLTILGAVTAGVLGKADPAWVRPAAGGSLAGHRGAAISPTPHSRRPLAGEDDRNH